MAVEREVRWSDEATANVDAIKDFIRLQWSEWEVAVFLDLLQQFEPLVVQFPNGYQRSGLFPGCRRAVIHPNVSVVYRVSSIMIEVVTVYDNRSSRS